MAKEKTAKPKEKKKHFRAVKETVSELKKVTWPSFGTVVKETGIVLVVVVAFLVVLMCFDQLLGWLYQLMIQGLSGDGTSAVLMSAFVRGGAGLPLCL